METQVLQAALQDVPTGNVKPVYQLCKSKPEAHIQPSHEEPAPQGTGVSDSLCILDLLVIWWQET